MFITICRYTVYRFLKNCFCVNLQDIEDIAMISWTMCL